MEMLTDMFSWINYSKIRLSKWKREVVGMSIEGEGGGRGSGGDEEGGGSLINWNHWNSCYPEP